MIAGLKRKLARWALAALLFSNCAATAETFYVAPDGDDGGAGNSANPWSTIQAAANRVDAGDTIIVRPGVYRESVVLVRGGLPHMPVSLVAEPGAILECPDPTQSLSAFDLRGGVGNVILQGFEIRGGYHESVFLRPGTHDVLLQSLYVHGNRSGIWVAGASNVRIHDSTVEGNSTTGIRIYQGSQAIKISDTAAVANNDGAGCQGNADGFAVEQDVSDFRCVRCRASNNGEDGFDVAAQIVVIDRSWATDNGCAGVKLYQGGQVTNSVIARNRTGVLTTNSSPNMVQVKLLHLSVADHSGIGVLLRAPMTAFTQAPYEVSLQGSIVAGRGKALEVEANVQFTEQNNILFRPDSTAPLISLHSATGSQTFSGQQINAKRYLTQTGLGKGTLAVDPEFAEQSEYTLLATSPAIDRGLLTAQQSLDVTGQVRPQGLAPDLGAQESTVSLSNHRPWPDPGPPRYVIAGTWLTVSAYGSVDPDDDPLSYVWTFGDGSPLAYGFSKRHLYLYPGSYYVELSVSDGWLQHTRGVPVSVDWPPTTHTQHDTALHPVRPIQVVIARGKVERRRTLLVKVQNADPSANDEPLGHLVELRATDGTCPAGTVVAPPDFETRLDGSQDRALVTVGQSRTARLALRFTRSAAPGCQLELTATTVLPGNLDPASENNRQFVPVTVIDRNVP